MLIGNAPCSWGITRADGNCLTWQSYLEEVAAAGYSGTELGPFGFMPMDADVLQPELDRLGLTVIGAAHVHAFGDTSARSVLNATLRDLSHLLRKIGASHVVLMDESEWYATGSEGILDAAGWQSLVSAVREAQEIVEGEFGLTLSFHPHIGTAVEHEMQIDDLLAETEIGLCLDTGHHAAWGQDPLAYMQRVWDRIAYVHLKNVDAAVRDRLLRKEISVAASYGAGLMVPLDAGVVDIRAVMRLLKARRFGGPVVVEQDVADVREASCLEMARRNRHFLAGAAQ